MTQEFLKLERFLSPREKKWRQTWPWISSKGIPSRVCITKYVPQLAQRFVSLLAWIAEVLACTRGQQIGNFGHRKGQQWNTGKVRSRQKILMRNFFEKKHSSNLSFYFQTKKGFNDKAKKYEAWVNLLWHPIEVLFPWQIWCITIRSEHFPTIFY